MNGSNPNRKDLMTNDPFAPTDPNTATPTAQEAPPVPDVATDRDRFSIKLTFKAAPGFDAEWINPWISGATADECAANTVALMTALKTHGVIDLATNAAEYIRSQYKGEARPASGGGRPPQQRQQSAPSTPPGVEGKNCQHGPMVYRTGTTKFGKDYAAFFCPTDKDAQDKCKPIFL